MGLTLPIYLVRRFAAALGAALLATFFIIMLGDLLELSREASSRGLEDVPLIAMALLHAPTVMQKGLPFVVLIASLTAFLRLARNSELVVLRAAGISAWRILIPPVIFVTVVGGVAVTMFNPLAAAALKKYETLDAKYIRGETSQLSISSTGLWLRQPDQDGHTVINATRAAATGTGLEDVTMFRFDGDGLLRERISAPLARLEPGVWVMPEATLWEALREGDGPSLTRAEVRDVNVLTDLTLDRILEGFADPRALSFWDLPEFIATLEASGFSAVRHRLHQQVEIAKPLLFAAMLLIGAGFSMRHARFGSKGVMVLGCVVSGFGLFFIMDIAQALGASGAIPIYVAAWVPPFTALLLGAGLLLFLEDG